MGNDNGKPIKTNDKPPNKPKSKDIFKAVRKKKGLKKEQRQKPSIKPKSKDITKSVTVRKIRKSPQKSADNNPSNSSRSISSKEIVTDTHHKAIHQQSDDVINMDKNKGKYGESLDFEQDSITNDGSTKPKNVAVADYKLIHEQDVKNMDTTKEIDDKSAGYTLDFEQYLAGNDQAPHIEGELDENMLSEINTVIDDTLNELKNTSNAKTCNGGNNNNNNNNNKQKGNNNNYNYNKNGSNNNNNNSYNHNYGGNGGSEYGGGDDGDDDDEKKRNNHWSYNHDDGGEDEEEEEEEDEECESDSTLNIGAAPFTPSQSNCSSISNTLQPIHETDEEDVIYIHPMQNMMLYDKPKQNNIKSSKAKYGYDPNPMLRAKKKIEIAKKLTDTTFPDSISEKYSNLYRYIDKTTSLQISNRCFTLCNMEMVTIISYDFYDKEKKNEKLYCVFTKQHTSINRPFKMKEKVYTKNEIVNQFKIKIHELPNSVRATPQFTGCLNHENKIQNVINTKLNIDKINWCKLYVHKRPNNKKRITLSLNKQEFIKILTNYMNKTDKEIKLFDILMFDNKSYEYHIHYVWIVRIADNTDIGISLAYNPKTDNININGHGIHLDKEYLMEQHELINRNHDCHCLDSFESNINDLIIGNPDQHENRAKAYKKTIDDLKMKEVEMKTEINDLKRKLIDKEKQMNELKQLQNKQHVNNSMSYTMTRSVPNSNYQSNGYVPYYYPNQAMNQYSVPLQGMSATYPRCMNQNQYS